VLIPAAVLSAHFTFAWQDMAVTKNILECRQFLFILSPEV
jgi:hypothetical protein